MKDRIDSWQGWRDQVLWTLDADDLIKANITGLTSVFKIFTKKFMTLEDNMKLFQRDTTLGCTEREVIYAFCMSRATVINDVT
jgi:hypothetical protein